MASVIINESRYLRTGPIIIHFFRYSDSEPVSWKNDSHTQGPRIVLGPGNQLFHIDTSWTYQNEALESKRVYKRKIKWFLSSNESSIIKWSNKNFLKALWFSMFQKLKTSWNNTIIKRTEMQNIKVEPNTDDEIII